MAKHQQQPVQIGFQPKIIERHQPRHVLAKNRSRRRCWALSDVTSAVIDERNEPISVRRFLGQLDSALLEHQLGIHQIYFLIESTLQQAGSKHGRKNLRFFLRNFTPIQEPTRSHAARFHAGQQHAQPMRDI